MLASEDRDFQACARATLLALLAWLGGACTGPPENSVARAAREREVSAWAGEKDRLAQELERLKLAVRDDERAAAKARADAAVTAAAARDARETLAEELEALLAVERELAAAQARLLDARVRLAALRTEAERLGLLLVFPAGASR